MSITYLLRINLKAHKFWVCYSRMHACSRAVLFNFGGGGGGNNNQAAPASGNQRLDPLDNNLTCGERFFSRQILKRLGVHATVMCWAKIGFPCWGKKNAISNRSLTITSINLLKLPHWRCSNLKARLFMSGTQLSKYERLLKFVLKNSLCLRYSFQVSLHLLWSVWTRE